MSVVELLQSKKESAELHMTVLFQNSGYSPSHLHFSPCQHVATKDPFTFSTIFGEGANKEKGVEQLASVNNMLRSYPQ